MSLTKLSFRTRAIKRWLVTILNWRDYKKLLTAVVFNAHKLRIGGKTIKNKLNFACSFILLFAL